jgi:hypothetical protein
MRLLHRESVRLVLGLSVLVGAAGGCRVSASVEPPRASHKSEQNNWVKTDLYFGLSKRGGEVISEDQWNKFVDDQITPRFPKGFTITSAQGHYLQDGRVIVEPSRLVTILHHPGPDSDERIDQIVKEYVKRFEQDSVLRSDQTSDVRFIGR